SEVLSKMFISQLTKYKGVEQFNSLNEIQEEEKPILSHMLTNMWDMDEKGSNILTLALYLQKTSKKECTESIKDFLQNMASHSLALAAIKKDSFALGCIGQCSKTAKAMLKNSSFDLSLDEIAQNKDYKYLTSLIKERWVIGKKK
ncbi:MAG: hypothetical protein EBU93_05905, partial [Chlamydiae bacterium]|nr:hypothetical protein [Chlamydiota bacterium]